MTDISSHRSKFKINISKQANNIAKGYDQPLPEILVDEKFQNFFDAFLDDIEIGRDFNDNDVKLKIVLDFLENQIIFYQLGTHGITDREWIEGIFKFGGETKDMTGRSGGAFGQGWKTWLAFCKEIKIFSNPRDKSENPGYSIITWVTDKIGNYLDPNPFAYEESDDVYKKWDIPNGDELENNYGSVWIFKLFSKEDKGKLKKYISDRLEELVISDFSSAIRNVLYSRYYKFINRSEIQICLSIKNEGIQEEIIFEKFDNPELIEKGILKPIIRKNPETWGTGRGKSSNNFTVDNFRIGIVKTNDLFELRDKCHTKDIFDGIRILVNDRVVKIFPNEISLGRNDYQIIGEINSTALKKFEKSTHAGFHQIEPTLRDTIRTHCINLKIAFSQEIGGLKTLGGKDTLTKDILNFLEEVGLKDIVDIVADEGKLDEEYSDNTESDIKEPPTIERYIKKIEYEPEFIHDQISDFIITTSIKNVSETELNEVKLLCEVFDELKEIEVDKLKPLEEKEIKYPGINLSKKPKYQHKRGKYKINIILKDIKNQRIDIKTKFFNFNKILERMKIEGVDPKLVLRGQPFRINVKCNFSGVPFPIELEFKRKHETDTEWEIIQNSKLKSYTKLSSQIFDTEIKKKEKRGKYEYALNVKKDNELIETIKTPIYVEKSLKSIQINTIDKCPIIHIRNPYVSEMKGKLRVSLIAESETRKDYEYLLNINEEGYLKFPVKEIDYSDLRKREYTISAKWNFEEPHEKSFPELEELLIKSIILEDKPEKERKTLKIKYIPDPDEKDIAYFKPEEKTIYINVLHPLFERLDTPEGLDKEIWYKGLGILLFYCFEDRIKYLNMNWWDFEAKFHELNKKFTLKR